MICSLKKSEQLVTEGWPAFCNRGPWTDHASMFQCSKGRENESDTTAKKPCEREPQVPFSWPVTIPAMELIRNSILPLAWLKKTATPNDLAMITHGTIAGVRTVLACKSLALLYN